MGSSALVRQALTTYFCVQKLIDQDHPANHPMSIYRPVKDFNIRENQYKIQYQSTSSIFFRLPLPSGYKIVNLFNLLGSAG
jgi:hypothetical protein